MRDILQGLVERGEIALWEPNLPGDSCLRTLFITREVNDGFDSKTWIDPQDADRYAKLEADFDRFISGDTISIGWNPFDKDPGAFMARVDPTDYGIWTIRSVAPKPGLRVLGAFCEIDVFIAMQVYARKDLGGPKDRRWAAARENAIARWNDLFAPRKPLVGGDVHDHFSEKIEIV